MEDSSSNSPSIDELLGSLPACLRCRSNKRRCDTQLPSCRTCAKAGVDCLFFDHVLEKKVSRSYVFALLQRLKIKDLEDGRREPGIEISHPSPSSSVSPAGTRDLYTSRYIGPLSCLAHSPVTYKGINKKSEGSAPPSLDLQGNLKVVLNQDTHEYLIKKYLTDIHVLYPFLDETLPFLSPNWSMESNEENLSPREKFILELVYSISSHRTIDNLRDPDQIYNYQKLADECHRKSQLVSDKAATDISIGSLEAITLAALHSTFSPKKGNFGQLIGLGARLAIDLGTCDRPSTDTNEESRMHRILMSIYCLENQHATTLDRPGLLPEPERAPDSTRPHDILGALYRVQSRFRCQMGRDRCENVSLLEEVDGYVPIILQMDPQIRQNLLAVVFETRLLIQPDDEESAINLLEAYDTEYCILSSLSPTWAYRAGLVIASGVSKRNANFEEDRRRYHDLENRFKAYGRCLVFLDQCSRRWASSSALKLSLQQVMTGNE